MKRIFYKDGQRYYYIHRNIEHFNVDETLSLYQKQKEQNYTLAKSQFASDFLKTIQGGNQTSAELLEASMSEEEIVDIINSSFKEAIENNLGKAISAYNFDTEIPKANQSIDNFIDTGDLRELDMLFKQIGEAAKLLKSNKNEIYILLNGKNGYFKHRSLTKLNTNLQQAISEWEGKTLNVSQIKLKQVAEKLEYITKKLISNKINKKSLKREINEIFTKNFGDYIVSKGVAKTTGMALKELRGSLIGIKDATFEESPEMKKLINEVNINSVNLKTSNKFKNFNIDIKENGTNYNIDLGFNTIWYNGENKKSNIIITQEKSFLNSIIKAFEKNIDYYYIYNTLGLISQNQELYNAMKEVIISRNIGSLLSGNGNGDFSQYLVANGKFYSIWDIINLIQNLTDKQSSYNPIVATIDGVSKISSMTDAVQNDKPSVAAAYARARTQNQLISTLGVTGHFYPSRLKNLIKN